MIKWKVDSFISEITKYIKLILLILLTFILGVQTTYAKTELVLPQTQVVSSIKENQSFNSLEKEAQPNIGFLKEKYRLATSESFSAQNTCNFSKEYLRYLANAGGNVIKLRRKLLQITSLPCLFSIYSVSYCGVTT
jgi:hypothetical protein